MWVTGREEADMESGEQGSGEADDGGRRMEGRCQGLG